MSETETFWEYDPATGTTKPVQIKKPAPAPTEQERTAAILAEIKRIYGDVSAQDKLRFYPSIQAKLFPKNVEKPDPLMFRLDQFAADPGNKDKKLTPLEQFQIASREPPPAPDALVPATLLEPRTPANTPERRLALANAKTDPKSNIQKTLRSWLKADSAYAANVNTHAGLAATALETRRGLEADILRMGWKVPRSRVP
jgi:hypothetical protein